VKGSVVASTVIHVAAESSPPFGIVVVRGAHQVVARVDGEAAVPVGAEVEVEADERYGWIMRSAT
jgi:uncharacterized OB-fold protein